MKKIILFLILFCGSWRFECEAEQKAGSNAYQTAYVVYVNDQHGFVVINSGSEDGVKKDDRFYIFRGDKEIGTIMASKVRPKISACDIEKLNYASVVRPYDLVIKDDNPIEKVEELTKKLETIEEEKVVLIDELGKIAAEKSELVKDLDKAEDVRIELAKEREEKEKMKQKLLSSMEQEKQILKQRVENINRSIKNITEGIGEPKKQKKPEKSKKRLKRRKRYKDKEVKNEIENEKENSERMKSIDAALSEMTERDLGTERSDADKKGEAVLQPSEVYIEIDAPARLIYLASIQTLKEGGYLITIARKKTGDITARKFLKKKGLGIFLRGFAGFGRTEDEVVLKLRRNDKVLTISMTKFSRREGRIRKKQVIRDSRIYKEASRIAQRIKDVAENS